MQPAAPLIVFCQPGDRRSAGIQQARSRLGMPPALLIPYAGLLEGQPLADLLTLAAQRQIRDGGPGQPLLEQWESLRDYSSGPSERESAGGSSSGHPTQESAGGSFSGHPTQESAGGSFSGHPTQSPLAAASAGTLRRNLQRARHCCGWSPPAAASRWSGRLSRWAHRMRRTRTTRYTRSGSSRT